MGSPLRRLDAQGRPGSTVKNRRGGLHDHRTATCGPPVSTRQRCAPAHHAAKARGFAVSVAIADKGYDNEPFHTGGMDRGVCPVTPLRETPGSSAGAPARRLTAAPSSASSDASSTMGAATTPRSDVPLDATRADAGGAAGLRGPEPATGGPAPGADVEVSAGPDHPRRARGGRGVPSAPSGALELLGGADPLQLGGGPGGGHGLTRTLMDSRSAIAR
jgi:hypothetical protein